MAVVLTTLRSTNVNFAEKDSKPHGDYKRTILEFQPDHKLSHGKLTMSRLSSLKYGINELFLS